MDKGNERRNRFCWPTQNRARADSPSKAPRTSSVLAASVYFVPLSPVLPWRRGCWFGVARLTSRTAAGPDVRNKPGVVPGAGGCCRVGLPGQSLTFLEIPTWNSNEFTVPEFAPESRWAYLESGIAPDSDPDCLHHCSPGPDWRVIGEQDYDDGF